MFIKTVISLQNVDRTNTKPSHTKFELNAHYGSAIEIFGGKLVKI